MGHITDWADDADAENIARPDTRSGNEASGNGIVDEKSSLKAADEDLPQIKINKRAQTTAFASDSEKATTDNSRRRTTFSAPSPEKPASAPVTHNASTRRRRRGTTRGSRKGFSASDDVLSYHDAESLLNMVQGHLVQFPYDWLITEEHGGNWLYQVDQVAPLQI